MPKSGPGVLEIRIHGVHGTPPTSMLGSKDVVQVAGDNLTGFYRTRTGELPNRKLPKNVVVEAYSWGALTSGKVGAGLSGFLGWVSRAAWLLLLPFAMSNLAFWARPSIEKPSTTARISARVVRTSALLLTLLMMLGACMASMDLIAWQCFRGGMQACPVLPDATNFLSRAPWNAAPKRLAVAALVPLLLVGLLWFLTRKTMERCEDVRPKRALTDLSKDPAQVPAAEQADTAPLTSTPAAASASVSAAPATAATADGAHAKGSSTAPTAALDDDSTGPVLARRKLWQGKETVLRLSRLHIGFAMLVIATFSGAPILELEGYWWSSDQPMSTPMHLLRIDLAAAIVVGVLIVCAVGTIGEHDVEYAQRPREREGEGTLRSKRSRTWEIGQFLGNRDLARVLVWLSGAILIADLLLLWIPDHGPVQQGGDLYLSNAWFVLTFIILAFVGAVAFVIERVTTSWQVYTSVAIVVILVVVVTGAQVFRLPDIDEALWAWGLLVAGWAALAIRHYYKHRKFHRAEAWGGAGISVLMNGAAWVALLFTTAVVTFAADQLNGEGEDVTNLQTSYRAAQVGTDLRARGLLTKEQVEALGTDLDRYTYLPSGGDIALEGGHVELWPASGTDPARVVLLSGTLVSDTLVRVLPGVTEPGNRIAFQLGSAEIHNAELALPAGTRLRLEDGCVATVDPSDQETQTTDLDCTVEDPGYVAGATINTSNATTEVVTRRNGGPDRDDLHATVRKPPQTPIVLPQVLIWAPLAQLIWFLIALSTTAWLWWWMRHRLKYSIRHYVKSDNRIAPRDQKASGAARLNAAFVHRAETMLDWIGFLTVPIVLGLITLSATGQPPWELAHWLRPVSALAMWAVLGIALLLVLVLSQMRTSSSTRRAVGILWDLTTFWPRAAHPLAPPCYAERVVPELITRVRWALTETEPRNRVILSAHSQGSAIAMAVVSKLEDHEAERVRIITYGSQIRAWYGRIFPSVLGPDWLGYEPTVGMPSFRLPEPNAPFSKKPPDGRDLPPPGMTDAYLPKQLPGCNTSTGQREKKPWGRGQPMPEHPPKYKPANQPRWINLFRLTDPIGFRVFSDKDSRWDRHVREVPTADKGDPTPFVEGHSNYHHTEEYKEIIETWYAEVPPHPRRKPFFADVPPFPEP